MEARGRRASNYPESAIKGSKAVVDILKIRFVSQSCFTVQQGVLLHPLATYYPRAVS